MQPETPVPSTFRRQQQGGLTIVMALVLVGVMGAATFSLSRNAIRELSMAGTIIQGNKAAAAADAGLDWAITWGQGTVDYAGFLAAGGSTTSQQTFLTGLQSTINSNYLITTMAGSSVPSMTLNQGGTATTDQNFDLEIRFLGPLRTSAYGSSTGSGASGGTAASGNAASGSVVGYVWRVQATGHATPTGGQLYQAQRELVISRAI
jgi:hypothetical protein